MWVKSWRKSNKYHLQIIIFLSSSAGHPGSTGRSSFPSCQSSTPVIADTSSWNHGEWNTAGDERSPDASSSCCFFSPLIITFLICFSPLAVFLRLLVKKYKTLCFVCVFTWYRHGIVSRFAQWSSHIIPYDVLFHDGSLHFPSKNTHHLLYLSEQRLLCSAAPFKDLSHVHVRVVSTWSQTMNRTRPRSRVTSAVGAEKTYTDLCVPSLIQKRKIQQPSNTHPTPPFPRSSDCSDVSVSNVMSRPGKESLQCSVCDEESNKEHLVDMMTVRPLLWRI